MNKLLKKIKEKAFGIGLSTFLLLIFGLLCFILYAYINKLDILSKLVSGEAFFIYLVILIVSLMVGTELWKQKILGEDEEDV